MKADLSRSTFSPQKHFHDVRLQQGRVQLDADWNEQLDIAAHRVETETVDVIGPCGAPKHDDAFALAAKVTDLPTEQQAAATALGALAPGDFFLSAGRFYAHGILCENDAPVKFSAQPDTPGGTPIDANGLYLAFLDVWPRHLTFLDDPGIREVALNGPDTATRVKTIWQVKLVKVGATGATPDCAADYQQYDDAVAAPTGELSARAEPGAASDKPCIIEPGAGYRRLENQLYRVEVHEPGANGTATFKWSRDNGAVAALWQPTADPHIIQLQRPPPDDKLGFAVGDWVEISDDTRDLLDQPGMLAQLTHVEPQFLTLGTLSEPLAKFTAHPKVRRWDSANAADTAGDVTIAANRWIDLEDGVQVQFESGTYRTGDYWLIPARTVTGDVEWPRDTAANPIASLPHGVRHVYCRIGFVDFDGTTITPTDCRALFPPLTEIQPGGDLKLHNKHLHGWGVVCGLQVHCGGSRTQVRIESGHAIDCEGTDILLKAARAYPLVERAKALALLDEKNSGDVLLRLTADENDLPVFEVVAPPADPQTSVLQQILEGTLWMDFFQKCLKPYTDYFQKKFGTDSTDTKLVPDNKRRLTAVINLLYQLVNATAGRRVWLSFAEHALLKGVYQDLVALLDSDTFCAMRDKPVAFPDYPFAAINIATIFGKSALVGARQFIDGKTAVAFDAGTEGKFYLFDLTKGEMTAELTAAGAAPLTVRDVFQFESPNRQPLLLVAATGSGNTTLTVFDLASQQIVGSPLNFFGLEVACFAASPFDDTVLALVMGRGLFQLDPSVLRPDAFDKPLATFNAAGHLAITGNLVAATVAAQGATAYSSLAIGRIEPNGLGLQTMALTAPDGVPAQGTDGIVIASRAAEINIADALVYVGVDARSGQTSKRILVVDPRKGATAELILPTAGAVALASAVRSVQVALADECELLWIDPTKNVVDTTQALPAQIAPVAFATANGNTLRFRENPRLLANLPLVAVNRVSQTLTVIPSNLVGVAQPPVDFNAFGAYRDSVLAAFKDVALRLAQGLKDCLCDRLLLDCPECAPDDVIYLARIEIRSSQVYHICNFIRREVLTFPKVKYWLSAVPILPLVHWVVEKFCCSVLPDFAAKISPAGTFVSPPTAVALAERIQARNFNLNLSDTFTRYTTLGKYAAQAAFTRSVLTPPVAVAAPVAVNDVLRASPESATAVLADQGVDVATVEDFHSALASDLPLIDAAAVPLNLQPGDKVNLYTENGRVVYYRRLPAATTAPASVTPLVEGEPRTAVGAVDSVRLNQDVATMRTQVAALQKAHSVALAARDRQISELKAATEKLRVEVAALTRKAPAAPTRARTVPTKPARRPRQK